MNDEKLWHWAGEHLRYELNMCRRSAQLVLALMPERNSLTNALLESYALHMRNLIEFIYWRPTRDDDVRAIHYVGDEEAWLTARGDTPPAVAATKTRADKQIAHMTEKRFTEGDPERNWRPLVEIAEILPGLRLFFAHIRPELNHPYLAPAMAGLAAMVEPHEEAR